MPTLLFCRRTRDWLQRLAPTGGKPTIRASLAVLVLACILPAALAEAGLAYYSYKAERQQLLDDTLARARMLINALDRELIAAEGAIRALGTSPSLASGDYEGFYQQAREVQAQQQADNIVLSEPSGQQLINTLKPYGTPLPVSRSPNFSSILTAEKAIVTDLFIGAVSKDPHFAVQIPIRRDGRTVNTLTIGMFPERIADLLPHDSTPFDQIAGVLDSSGTIVARTGGQTHLVGRKVPAEFMAQMAGRTEGHFSTTTADGTPAIVLFSQSTASRWVSYLTIPQAFLTDRLWQRLQWVVAIPVLFGALALVLVWVVGGAIARSITRLTGPAIALGYGQAIEIAPLYLREADAVGHALKDASAQLRKAQYEARHDKLTGLANRALFNDMAHKQRLLCERMRIRMAVLYIDLDGFKAVNDTHGHAVGDALLCAVARRLTEGVRSSDVVARLGGDEFAALLIASGSAEASAVAQKLVESISAPYLLDGQEVSVSASIGIASFPETGATVEDLLESADQAMYQAKQAGKRRFVVAKPLSPGAGSRGIHGPITPNVFPSGS